MKKITEISLCNYRAFLNKHGEENKYKISLPKGENLLIYGENGSGKSSLFKGLRDVFYSANNPGITVIGNIFAGQVDPDTEIKIKISETQEDGNWSLLEELIFNEGGSTTPTNANLLNTTKAFLTYRDILETYFLDRDNAENPNLFNLFFEVLLARLTDDENNQDIIAEIKGLETSIETIENAFNQIKNDLPELSDKEILEDLKEPINEKIRQLNGRFIEIINGLLNDTNRYLQEYFKSNVNIGITNPYEFLSLEGEFPNFSLNKKLKFVLGYFNYLVDDNYSLFLNEARLSAIAICIYLAALKKESLRVADNLKFLFLDDIFIGVDTSNRIPLLKILADDFMDFQIFISTYDREWFELVKKYQRTWKSLELYVGENTICEVPVLIQDDQSPLKKGKNYIDSFDYFSAANNIRKALEELLENILPETYLCKSKDLESSINLLFLYYANLGCSDLIDVNLNRDLILFKDIVLNPMSHYDLKSPIYKAEVVKAYNTVIELQMLPRIERKVVLNVGDILFYKNTSKKYNATYLLTETLYEIFINGVSSRFNYPKHKIITWTFDGLEFSDKYSVRLKDPNIKAVLDDNINFHDRIKRIKHFLDITDDILIDDFIVHSKTIKEYARVVNP